MGSFDIEDFFDRVIGPQHNRRGNEAVLVTLDGPDHCRLGRGRLVVMYHPDSSQKLTKSVVGTFPNIGRNQRESTHRHGDSHISFGYSVHRGTDEGGIEGYVASDFGLKGDIAGRELDPPGEEQKIVVGEATVNFRVHEILDGEPILVVVLLEDLQSLRRWEQVLSSHLGT